VIRVNRKSHDLKEQVTMRIQRVRPLLTAVCIAVITLSGIAFAVLDPQKFVAGWRLNLTSEGAFYDVLLSHEVYQFGRSLNELAVLDANGEPMPFYRVAVPSAAVSEEFTTRGVSPIYVRQEDGAAADLRVTTQGDRTDVVVTRSAVQESEHEVVAFIVDAREIEGIPTAIELVWDPLDRPFLMSVSIAHSDDLTHWRRVGSGSIASLAIDGASVTHGKIAITGREGGYYRLKWSRLVSDWQLESVVLATSALTELATFNRVDLSPIEVPEEQASDDALYFDAGGALPTTSIDLVFPDKNRWGNASIYFGNSTDGPWQQLGSRRLFYDIDFEGERLASEPLSLRRVEARYWKVLVDSKTTTEDMQLRLEYPEERLRFAANGEPPYQLVGGTLSDEAGPDTTFAAVMGALDPDKAIVATAHLGTRTVLGGPAVLVIPTEFPWRTVYLWAALLAAVLVVGFMAVRLAREMLVNNK
jgi:hypothetical protein